MRSHVHTDVVWALTTIAVVVVGVKLGQWSAAKIGQWSPALGSALGGAFNLGVH